MTLLHQKQREKIKLPSGKEALAATLEDIAIANRLAPEVLGRSLDELPPQTRKLWNVIRALVNDASEDWKRHTFTRREIREQVGWSVTQVRVHLERLHELEYLTPMGGRNGVRFEYRLLIDPKSTEGTSHIGLLETEKLQAVGELPPLRPEPDGKSERLTEPDKKGESGLNPLEIEPSAQADGQIETHIRDSESLAVVS